MGKRGAPRMARLKLNSEFRDFLITSIRTRVYASHILSVVAGFPQAQMFSSQLNGNPNSNHGEIIDTAANRQRWQTLAHHLKWEKPVFQTQEVLQ